MDLKLKHNSGVRKRPEMALYKPPMGKILSKKEENDTNVPQKQDFAEEVKQDLHQKNDDILETNETDFKDNKINVNNNKNFNKKPDIQVYVPRKLNNNNSNNSDKEKTVAEKPEKPKQQNFNQNHERNYERKANPRSGNNHRKHDNKTVERSFRENSNKTSNNCESLKRKDNKMTEVLPKDHKVYEEHNHKGYEEHHHKGYEEHNHKSVEPKIINSEGINRVSKTEKFYYNEDYDENYYNYEFKAKNSKSQRHNRNIDRNTDRNTGNSFNNSNNNSNSYNSLSKANNDYNENNNMRSKHEPVKQRNYTSKPQHRYEQQIPPRFLRKQQLLKKQIEMESVNTEQTQPHEQQRQVSLQQTQPLEQQRQVSPQQTQQSNQSESFPHRGLIRLPATNQISPQEFHPHINHNTDQQNISSQIKFDIKNSSNTNKPCVAIRPTQHVSVDNYPVSSPSSSPDAINIFTNTSSVDNYQQIPLYMRSNYTEYSIPHFMPSSAVESDLSRIQNISDISRKKLKPIIEKSFTEAIAAENDLHLCIKDQQKVEQIRYRIQLRYESIILTDLRVCAEYNIEQRLWKSAFYQFIEHYRRLSDQNSDQSQEMKTAFHKIVDEASLFFENLLVKMQETYNFGIERLLAHEYDRETENYDSLKLAAISAQKIYLYLGDLSRYKECEIRNSNFVKSKFFYVRAQQLAPKNGRSYNQLALLAMYQNRRLDAVYYYMRSLAASNPFLTARENLLAIFDEVRRKYELTDKKRKQDLTNQKNRNKETDALASDNERIEIWIRSDGTSAVCSNYKQFFEEESPKDELEMLTSVDLNKRFVLSFLHVHGKLFSRVGMETFVPVVNQMLSEFHCLLRRSPIPVSSHRLSQLLAITTFAVINTPLKYTSYGHNCRSLLQEQAIQVTFAMISLILECALSSLQENKRIETHPNFNSDDLSELLPTIKLWTDWMSCQKHLWCPPPPPSDFKIGCKGDIWTIFAEFLTSLTKINVRSVKLLPSKLEGCEPVILPEDTSLAGFLPLLGSPQCVQFAQPPYDKEKARTCLRITVIQFFGDYLCGIVEPYLKFDVERKRFVSLIPTSSQSNSEEINKNFSDDIVIIITVKPVKVGQTSENENDDYSNDLSSVETTSNSTSDYNPKSPEQIEIEQLWQRQEALKKAKERQEMMKQKVDAVLSEENQSKPSRIIIQPRYIIPDTNCFIDHLAKIKALINSGYYDLIVPLIVINELKCLKSRGIKTAKPLTFTDDHSGQVGKAAMETIDYLVQAFNDKNLRLKAITSKGSLLDNINFISETFNESQGNSNDDFILNACLQFIKDKPSDKCLKESLVESNSIFREAILLTEDRNLRVKALGHNVPVKSLPIFIKWANIPINRNRV